MDFNTVLKMAHDKYPDGWPDCDRLIFARGEFTPLPLHAIGLLDMVLVKFIIHKQTFEKSYDMPELVKVKVTTGAVYDRVSARARYYTDIGSELYIDARGILCSPDGQFSMALGGPYYLGLPEPGRVVECDGKVFVYSHLNNPLWRHINPLQCTNGEVLEYWRAPSVNLIESGMFLMKGDELIRVTRDTTMVEDFRLLTHEEKVKVTTGELLCKL